MKRYLLLPLALVFAMPALAAEAAQPPLVCNPVEGIDNLLEPGRILLVGEFHGTAESPAFVADAACLAKKAGRSVTVGLEVPVDEETRVKGYLSSTGSEADRAALLNGPFWQDEYQDGRRSEAMSSLIEALRKLSRGSAPVHVILLDSPGVVKDAQARDRAMAERLESAAQQRPRDLFIVLTGNIHNRLAKGVPWNAQYEPMGFVLAQHLPSVHFTSLNVAYAGGTAWSCETPEASSCKSREIHGKVVTKGRKVLLWDAVNKDGYSGIYNVDAVTASPPAKRSTRPSTNPSPPRSGRKATRSA
jgi:hypothetical protein